jgi:hypothetical protein
LLAKSEAHDSFPGYARSNRPAHSSLQRHPDISTALRELLFRYT